MAKKHRDPRNAFRKKAKRDPLDPSQRPSGRRRERSRREIAQSCAKKYFCPIFFFFAILGVAFGVIFGIIPVDHFKNLFGFEVPSFGDGGTGGTTGKKTDSPTVSPTPPPPVDFMRCPENGECCNGLESNCDLRPNEIMWATVHNAMHDDLLGNNRAPLEEALEAGYRGLQLDVCLCDNPETSQAEIVFCHSICAVGRRSFDEVFPNINRFLNKNPTESVLINFEISKGTPTPEIIWNTIEQYQGLKSKTYIHTNNNAFPSMRELQQSGKQLLLFKHNGIDCLNTASTGCSNRIAEFHKYALETEYNFQDEEAVANFDVSCVGTRGGTFRKDFYHINNFVTKPWGPSIEAAKIINKKDFLVERIAECEKITKVDATMVSVDFWQQGDLLRVTQDINLERGKRRRRRSLRSRFSKWIHS